MTNLNLKGIWIPIEILEDEKLSDKEKIIYSIIIFLSKDKKYCYCTNKTFSELLSISITQVSKLINSLKDKKYITITIDYKKDSKQVECRKLLPVKSCGVTYLTRLQSPPQEKLNTPVEDKFKEINYNNRNNNKIYGDENFKKNNFANYEQRDYSSFDFAPYYAN